MSFQPFDLGTAFYNSVHSSSTFGSSSEEPTWKADATHIVGACLYSILFFVTLGMYIYKRVRYGLPFQQLSTIFYIGLPIFMVLRTIWMIFEMCDTLETDIADNLINRIALCVFLFVFNALLFYWIDTIHTTVNVAFAKEAFRGSLDYEFITPIGRLFFWLVTGLVICLTLILAIARNVLKGTSDLDDSDYKNKKKVIDVLYDVNNIIISLLFLVYGLCFFIYGTMLNCRIKKNKSTSLGDLIKAEIFSVVLMICFAIRCVMFSYRVLTGKLLNDDLYVVMSYFIPEIIPTLLCLWSVNTKMFSDAESGTSGNEDDDDETA